MNTFMVETEIPNTVEVKVPAILLDLIPQYLENRRKELAVLGDASVKGDFQTIQNIGHKLKGNAASYGFEQLTDIGTLLEKAAREHDAETVSAMLRSYTEYLNKVRIVPA